MRVLVLGGASCLFHDLQAVGEWDGIRIAVNDAGYAVRERIDHWATLHPEKLPAWVDRRRRYGGNMDFITWSRRQPDDVDHILTPWDSGSSGMLAVQVALDELNATEVVLCGVPLEESPHFFSKVPWVHAITHRKAWEKNLWRMKGKVHSLSGWTRELLGAPEWIGA